MCLCSQTPFSLLHPLLIPLCICQRTDQPFSECASQQYLEILGELHNLHQWPTGDAEIGQKQTHFLLELLIPALFLVVIADSRQSLASSNS